MLSTIRWWSRDLTSAFWFRIAPSLQGMTMGGSPNSLVLRRSQGYNVARGVYILPPILVSGRVKRVLEVIGGAKSPHFFKCWQYKQRNCLLPVFEKMAPHSSTNAETEGPSCLSIFR